MKAAFITSLALLAVLGISSTLFGAENEARATLGMKSTILPHAFAPTGEFGGIISGEFDRRTIGGELVYMRRACLIMGYSPTPKLAIWAEGGVASLQLFFGNGQPQGDYGPAFGVGWVWSESSLTWQNLTPFISGRATYLQSKLLHDVQVGGTLKSRRSRLEWNEGTIYIGLSRQLYKNTPKSSLFYGAFAFRQLLQDEYRTTRSGASYQQNRFDYSSGFRPGLELGWQRVLAHRLIVRISGEAYAEGVKLNVTVGQWGAP